ncbi:hypothetical protein ACRAWF_23075 [Streptomyces sp. L7]
MVREQLHGWGLARLADTAALAAPTKLTGHARRRTALPQPPDRTAPGARGTLLCEVDDDDPTLRGPAQRGPRRRVRARTARDRHTRPRGGAPVVPPPAGKTVWFELHAAPLLTPAPPLKRR